ncbi:DUF4382 domain-containing protein [Metallosphaera tengchongensis]|uniref:DUF4382 domain-containing protein n=1 Tax=Metallosphaera tengchongensis TaxID=1532350 RepID=A0A6N0NTW2_9CREN|nr:DUF4382 domain-containing protein [Metallosphaera tengchongensis]QKR00132.1 DUF4382 domain-containing protein [Metallosphaera tengchongensis]
MKTWLIAVAVVVLVIVGYFGYVYLNTGPVSVYVQDAPSGFAVYLTVSSIMLHQVNGSWITVSNKTVTFQLSSNLTQLVSARVPAGKYNEIFLVIKNASVSLSGYSVTVPSNVLKIHFISDKDLVVASNLNAQVIISFPHVSLSAGSLIISPSITAEAIG